MHPELPHRKKREVWKGERLEAGDDEYVVKRHDTCGEIEHYVKSRSSIRRRGNDGEAH